MSAIIPYVRENKNLSNIKRDTNNFNAITMTKISLCLLCSIQRVFQKCNIILTVLCWRAINYSPALSIDVNLFVA